MDLPRCKICGGNHRLGGCPQISSRGSTEGRAKAETKTQNRHSDSLARDGGNCGTGPIAGIKPSPREAKSEARSSAGLEQSPSKRQVVGSSPTAPAKKPIIDRGNKESYNVYMKGYMRDYRRRQKDAKK